MQSLMIRWTSQASVPILEHVDLLPSTVMPLPTSPMSDGGNNKPLPPFGPMDAPIAVIELRPPPPVQDPLDSIPDTPPPSPVASIPTSVLPNAGDDHPVQIVHCSQPEPSGMEHSLWHQVELQQVDLPRKPTSPQADDRLQPSTSGVHNVPADPTSPVAAIDPQPSTSVVDVIPEDPASPQAAHIVPQSVKRYLQRWPLGDSVVNPIFDNTTLHDFQTSDDNEDDDKRRAALIENIPSHVHVSVPPAMTAFRWV